MSGGVFVSGTDTGVGKTVVSCALIRGLRARGVPVGAMKPIETGVGPGGPEDAQALQAASASGDPLPLVCPQQFALPAAPTVAARSAGTAVDLAAVHAAYAELRARHRFLVVEGAGGLLVPAAEKCTMVELAAAFDLPLLLVARAALGTLNHTRLSLEACEARGLPLVGVVVSHADGELSHADARNLGALREDLGDLLVGEIPPLAPGAEPPQDALCWERIAARLGLAPARFETGDSTAQESEAR